MAHSAAQVTVLEQLGSQVYAIERMADRVNPAPQAPSSPSATPPEPVYAGLIGGVEQRTDKLFHLRDRLENAIERLNAVI